MNYLSYHFPSKEDTNIHIEYDNGSLFDKTTFELNINTETLEDTNPKLRFFRFSSNNYGIEYNSVSHDPANPRATLSNISYDSLTRTYSGNIEWHFANDSLHFPDSTHLKVQFKAVDIREYIE